MTNTQEMISREVRLFMASRNITATELARLCGMNQSLISGRLVGRIRWNSDDLERLRRVGISVSLPAFQDEPTLVGGDLR